MSMLAMRSRLLVGLLVASLLSVVPALAQVKRAGDLDYPPLPAVDIPTPERVVLPNGLVLMVIEDHELPLVNASARIRTGSLVEPADDVGLASVTGAMLRAGGTTSLPPDELDEFLENKAASVETSIGLDVGRASVSALEEDFPEVLQVFADVLRRPAFDAGRLHVEAQGQNASIARQNDDPNDILSREFDKVLYGKDSPYARIPTYQTIANITRDDLVAWHKKYFHPNRIVLGIWGDITVAEATALVKKIFGDWPKGPEPPPLEKEFPPPPDAARPGVYQALKKDVNQSSITIGHQGELRTGDPDFFPVAVLNEVLGGSFASRLFSNVRSAKGLAYAVSGSVGSSFVRVEPFSMFMTTRTETTGAGIDALLAEARAIGAATPPTDEEVARGKAAILNSFVFQFATVGQVLNRQLDFEYYDVPLDWLDRYRAEVEKVTTAQVRAVAQRYIHPDRFSIVIVGTGEGYDKKLDAFGTVRALDISIPPPPGGQPQTGQADGGSDAPGAAGASKKDAPMSPAAFMAANAMLDKATDAVGGLQKLRELTSYQQTATMQMPQGQSVKARLTVVLPDKVHQELTSAVGTTAIVVTPEASFLKGPQGTMPLPESQRVMVEREAWYDPLLILVARGRPGFKAVHTGKGTIGKTTVQLVEVTRNDNTVTLGIDGTTGRILNMSYRGLGPSGTPAAIEQRFDDFRAVDGYTVPFKVTSTIDGKPGPAATVQTVIVNAKVDPGLFTRPKG
ncbi:MAG: M16 family metallopeptidase [Vicinamibacteraceae bacterium]